MQDGIVFVDGVTIPTRLRQVDEAAVGRLAESMAEIGLQQPISVFSQSDDHLELVAGAHRLKAAKRLGWDQIPCVYVNLTEDQRALWEIDENLMRSELSQAEYSRHVALRKDIYERLHPETAHGASGRGRKKSDQVGHSKAAERFTADTAAKTGKSETSVKRAVHRGEQIAGDVLARIKGTRLDTGKYQDELAKLDEEAQREKVEADLAQPELQKPTNAPKRRQQQAEDRDLSEEAADQVARVLSEYVPGEHWDGVKANLHKCRGKQVAQAMDRLTGVAVFDNTRGGEAA
jgi:hypothetical protein